MSHPRPLHTVNQLILKHAHDMWQSTDSFVFKLNAQILDQLKDLINDGTIEWINPQDYHNSDTDDRWWFLAASDSGHDHMFVYDSTHQTVSVWLY